MKQLLEIKTVPMQIEYRVNNAKIERISESTDMNISRDKGGFLMKTRPIQVNIDTFDARNSVVPTAMESVYQNAEQGKKAVYDTIARFVEEGYLLVHNTGSGGDILNQIFASRVTDEKYFELTFIPKYPAAISWTPPDLEIRYELDKLTFNWQTNEGRFEFIPADIEFNIKQYPRVIIEYVGSPLYVTPSASPNHASVDIKT